MSDGISVKQVGILTYYGGEEPIESWKKPWHPSREECILGLWDIIIQNKFNNLICIEKKPSHLDPHGSVAISYTCEAGGVGNV
jgi:hypothetical protein